MGFDEGSIILNSEDETYYAGQTIYGKLVFEQDKVKTFRGLFVKVKGFCKVHWTTTHTRRHNKRSQTYVKTHESYEEYFSRKVFLLGGESGEYHLQPGKHELPFDCPIPPNCPSSFEGSYGHVRYEIKIVVDRAFKLDQEKKLRIRVIAPMDLNMEPYCKEPMQFEMDDSYSCCCISHGSSETVVKLPVSGYCPGQLIPIEVNCENHGSVKINKIKLAIKKRITYHATQNPDTRHESDTTVEIKKGPIPGDTSRSWVVEMVVPDMDLYNMLHCRYIDIDYDFKVSVCPKGCYSDCDDTRRIVIGTVPLAQDNDMKPSADPLPNQIIPVYNQPISTLSPCPTQNSPYPNPNSPYPNANSPYPNANSPYPNQNSPYPNANSPYPNSNSPYPNPNSPYPGAGNSYPKTTSPYPPNPQTTSHPGDNVPSPYPPYSNTNSYPGGNQINPQYPIVSEIPDTSVSPYPIGPGQPNVYAPGSNPSPISAATIPTLPSGANVPYPTISSNNPYATASAPEPSAPDDEKKN